MRDEELERCVLNVFLILPHFLEAALRPFFIGLVDFLFNNLTCISPAVAITIVVTVGLHTQTNQNFAVRCPSPNLKARYRIL
jgi:hypothetical protein